MEHEREEGDMAIYDPTEQASGYAAKMSRVNALRALERAGVVEYDRYEPGRPPEFVIRNTEHTERRPTSREVPVYVLGVADFLRALKGSMPDVIDAAFARESVVDRESLAEAILAELDTRYGTVSQAADRFEVEDPVLVMAAAS